MDQSRPQAAAALRRFYVAARSHFGYTNRWWPGTPVELAVTAVLVQRCDWTVTWKAAKRLRDAGLLNLMHMAEADAAAVTELIQAVAFPRQKAIRLIQIAGRLVTSGFATIEELLQSGSTEQVREQLQALPRIGDERADSILLLAADCQETFVVDANARRLFQRLDLLDGCDQGFWRLPYERLRRFFLDHITDFLPLYDGLELAADLSRGEALLRDFHAQVVELGTVFFGRPATACTPGSSDVSSTTGRLRPGGSTGRPAFWRVFLVVAHDVVKLPGLSAPIDDRRADGLEVVLVEHRVRGPQADPDAHGRQADPVVLDHVGQHAWRPFEAGAGLPAQVDGNDTDPGQQAAPPAAPAPVATLLGAAERDRAEDLVADHTIAEVCQGCSG